MTEGWDRDPLGKLILGLPAPLGSTSKVTWGVEIEAVVAMVAEGISGTSTTSLSWISVDANWFPVGILAFLLSTAAKNYCVDANASSLLASFVPCMILHTSWVGLSCIVFYTCTRNFQISCFWGCP